ncbi:MAG: hypothetical protein IJ151_09095 [Bacteroidales bacterium]|nr:hypothetical protein [Bacteroidales bacterium]
MAEDKTFSENTLSNIKTIPHPSMPEKCQKNARKIPLIIKQLRGLIWEEKCEARCVTD